MLPSRRDWSGSSSLTTAATGTKSPPSSQAWPVFVRSARNKTKRQPQPQAERLAPLMLTKIHHVGVVVKSADEAMKFYRDALGLKVTADRIIEDQGVRGVLLEIGGSEIELLEPTRDDTGVAKFL